MGTRLSAHQSGMSRLFKDYYALIEVMCIPHTREMRAITKVVGFVENRSRLKN